MARLFVAVRPPEEVLDTVAGLPRPDVAGLRWTSRDQWHVTLRFLGSVEDPSVVADAVRQASLGPTAPVVARIGPTVDRFGHRVLHLPVSGLEELARLVAAATADMGRPPEDRPFAGHLTLARAGRGARVDLRPLAGTPSAASWPVDHLSLMESHLGRARARYEELARFPVGQDR